MRRLLHVAMTRARERLVLAYPRAHRPRRAAAAVAVRRGGAGRGRRRVGGARGGAVRARRDAAVDVPAAARRAADDGRAGRRAARRAALRHRPRRLARGRALPRAAQARRRCSSARATGELSVDEALPEVNARLLQAATVRAARDLRDVARSTSYLLDAERDERLRARRGRGAREPSLEPFLPRRGDGLLLSASRHRDLPDVPAEVQVRARLPDPERADAQPALRDPRPPGARALPRGGAASRRCPSCSGCSRPAGGAAASATPRRSASCAPRRRRRCVRYHERFRERGRRAGLVRARVPVPDRPAPAARPRRPRRPAARRRLRADRLQDRPPEDRRAAARGRPALALRGRRARGLAARGRASRPTTTCSTTRRCRSSAPTRTATGSPRPCSRSPTGIHRQGFEPTPSYAACSMCDYRIACPAAER